MTRRVRLLGFASVKGGVGKSTLAVQCAHVLAQRGDSALVVDGDLLGTSLALGLGLCAPDVVMGVDGSLDLSQAPHGFLDRETTLDRWRRRRDSAEHDARFLPFLNDAMRWSDQSETPLDARGVVWRAGPDALWGVVPSSSLIRDVELVARWVHRLDQSFPVLAERFTEVLRRLVAKDSKLTHVFVDLPPGLAGWSRVLMQVLVDASQMDAGIRWESGIRLITTPDRNALFATMEVYQRLLFQVPSMVPVVNQAVESLRELKDAVRMHNGETYSGVEDALTRIPLRSQTLGRLFVRGNVMEDSEASPDLIGLIEGERP